MTDKDLRSRLYARQRRILSLPQGHESVCLPGGLLALNPGLIQPVIETPQPTNQEQLGIDAVTV